MIGLVDKKCTRRN